MSPIFYHHTFFFVRSLGRKILDAVQEPVFSVFRNVVFGPSRPQYIYGPLTNKRDYLDWFFDRVVHGIEFVPLPLHGDQLVALTHAEDVASMLASVIGNENAPNQVDRRASFTPFMWAAECCKGSHACMRFVVHCQRISYSLK